MSKTIAIMQPTYIPWMGYFDLMDQVDVFVLLDNVQFSKQSWQQRNRIKSPSGELLLTIPVRGKLGQLITEVELAEHRFLGKHLAAIEQNYRRAPFFDLYFPKLKELYKEAQSFRFLSEFTCKLLFWIKAQLGIETKIVFASLWVSSDDKIDRLLDLCQILGASAYLSPKGADNYLKPSLSLFKAQNIYVAFQEFTPPAYGQLYPPFISHLSSLDLLFNQGPNSLKVIQKGRKISEEIGINRAKERSF
jgi:hypothetical protein